MRLDRPLTAFVFEFVMAVAALHGAGAAPCIDRLPPPLPRSAWHLVWQDEFDAAALDSTKWTALGPEKRRDGYWLPDAVRVEGDGFLRLITERRGTSVASGAISTRGKFENTFGLYVARCRMPSQAGHWPAIWLTCPGASARHVNGRGGAEIDLVEMPWREKRVSLNVHWGGYRSLPKSEGIEAALPDPARGFHVFALVWEPETYTFFIDGVEVWRTQAGGVSRVPEYINVTDEVGVWAGDIAKASLPDTFAVDYVRVYEAVPESVDVKR